MKRIINRRKKAGLYYDHILKVSDKTRSRLCHLYAEEILKRGGEVDIEGKYDKEVIRITDGPYGRKSRLCVLHCEGWRQYSRTFGARQARLSYLCGHDDSGPWAIRVAGTITRVNNALSWITPRKVIKAIDQGKRVLRQGDIFAVEAKKDESAGNMTINDTHVFYKKSRVLLHDPRDGRKHTPMVIDFPCRFEVQRAYQMGRSGLGAPAD